jgi:hypothetical protein
MVDKSKENATYIWNAISVSITGNAFIVIVDISDTELTNNWTEYNSGRTVMIQ